MYAVVPQCKHSLEAVGKLIAALEGMEQKASVVAHDHFSTKKTLKISMCGGLKEDAGHKGSQGRCMTEGNCLAVQGGYWLLSQIGD